MSKDFFEALKLRRSFYGLGKESTIPDEKIIQLIKDAVKYTPTAFSAQGGRVIVLLGENHNKVWDITKEALRKIVPPENFSKTEDKINSFRDAYGTVLFFEDQSTIESFQKQFELYKDNFPIWAQQAAGMLQLIVWTALEIEGLGASLQHYNPLIDEEVRNQWNIPTNWKLVGQMPFGKPTAPVGDKNFAPLDERVKVFK